MEYIYDIPLNQDAIIFRETLEEFTNEVSYTRKAIKCYAKEKTVRINDNGSFGSAKVTVMYTKEKIEGTDKIVLGKDTEMTWDDMTGGWDLYTGSWDSMKKKYPTAQVYQSIQEIKDFDSNFLGYKVVI